ncbi:MAG: LysE/ArgO family amino acid transporter [Pseudomonadota bacterium]
MLTAGLTGFASGFSLILAIGAQNAFVLRQGLLRQHVFWVCLVCALSDAILITVGVGGLSTITAMAPWLEGLLIWGGAAFLIVYGLMAIRRAMSPERMEAAREGAGTLSAAILTCLALTWLNPHVYLDTVALIGAISLDFEGQAKIAFGTGAVLASLVFFFGLGYGARLLQPIFARPRSWQVLDVLIALVMWSIAASLIASAL